MKRGGEAARREAVRRCCMSVGIITVDFSCNVIVWIGTLYLLVLGKNCLESDQDMMPPGTILKNQRVDIGHSHFVKNGLGKWVVTNEPFSTPDSNR